MEDLNVDSGECKIVSEKGCPTTEPASFQRRISRSTNVIHNPSDVKSKREIPTSEIFESNLKKDMKKEKPLIHHLNYSCRRI